LRGFANFLEIDHASLSQMLRRTRPCSPAVIRRLSARIGLSLEDIAGYVAEAEIEREYAGVVGENRAIAEDAARLIGSWTAFATLELMQLKEFRPDVRWIARVLGIESHEVQVTLQQLIRLGFLQMQSSDKWIDLTHGTIYREDNFNLLVLERLAKRSLDAQLASARNAPTAPRVHGSITLAVTEGELARLIASSEHFLSEVSAKQQGDGNAPKKLYHIEVHCYPILVDAAIDKKGNSNV